MDQAGATSTEAPKKGTLPEFDYDVFISYSHRDQEWVWSWLVPRLKDAGIRVCTD